MATVAPLTPAAWSIPAATSLDSLPINRFLRAGYRMYMEDTPVEQLPERSQAAAKIQKEFGQIKFEDIKKDHDKRKSMLYFLAYSDFQPPLVNIMDVHLLEAKTKFEDRVNAVLGIAHVFYLYRSRS